MSRLHDTHKLLLRRGNRVRSVGAVGSSLESVVATDGAGDGVLGVGGAEHNAARLDGIESLPSHADNGAGKHVLDERREERLGREVLVVLLEVLLGRRGELEGNELEATLLEARDNLADEAEALDLTL